MVRKQKDLGPDSSNNTLWTENFFIKYRFLMNAKSGFLIIFFETLAYVLIILFLVLLDPTTWSQQCTYKTSIQFFTRYFNIGSKLLAFLTVLYLGYCLRSARGDAFSIKKEFFSNIYTTGVAVILASLLSLVTIPPWVAASFDLLALHSVIATSTVWPYFLSQHTQWKLLNGRHNNRKYRTESCESQIGTESKIEKGKHLVDVLNNSEGFQIFLGYLETEFSTENLLFWEAVEQLKLLDPGSPNTPLRINNLYKNYIPENSPYQINISSHDRIQLAQIITTTLPRYNHLALEEKNNFLHVFDDIQKVIYELMNNDSFPRFQWTKEAEIFFGTNRNNKNNTRMRGNSRSIANSEMDQLVIATPSMREGGGGGGGGGGMTREERNLPRIDSQGGDGEHSPIVGNDEDGNGERGFFPQGRSSENSPIDLENSKQGGRGGGGGGGGGDLELSNVALEIREQQQQQQQQQQTQKPDQDEFFVQ